MRVCGGEEMGTFGPKRGIFFMIRQPPPNPGGKDVVWRGGLGDHVLWSGLGPSGSVKGWEWWLHKKSMCDLRDHYPARRGRGLDAVQRPIAWNPVGGFFGYHGSLFEKNENVI